MARIDYINPENAHWLVAGILARRGGRNLHKILGHSPHVTEAFVRVAETLRFETELDPSLRELAILRVGILSKANYEIEAHKIHARRAGLTHDQIEAVTSSRKEIESLPSLHCDVIALTDDIVHNVRASDATFSKLSAVLSARALVELVVTIGFYMAACRVLETFDIDPNPT
jgi:AhpD family alkylhydroperoxidase